MNKFVTLQLTALVVIAKEEDIKMGIEKMNDSPSQCPAFEDRVPWKVPDDEASVESICGKLPSNGFCCSLGDLEMMQQRK